MSSSQPASNPSVGSIVSGKYRIEHLLGSGGMGAVFEARNTITGKRVALKWMHPEVAQSPEAADRFVREAQASARVRHPNVVDVYDVVTEGGALFLVMELLEGEPLRKLMERADTPLPTVIGHLVGAMRGVAAAHRQHVVHRDIKPDNIFLARVDDDRPPVPKVLDFGISKLTGAGDLSVTTTGAAVGTPLYMSVEQLSGLKDIDGRTDVYAFGVILYEAITGSPPFMADTYPLLAAKIMMEHAPSPKSVRPEIPEALSDVIARAMAKDRTQRTPNLETLIRELEPFATETGFLGNMTLAARHAPPVWTPSSRPSARAVTPRPNHTLEPVSVRQSGKSTPNAVPGVRSARPFLYGAALAAIAALLWLWLRAGGEESKTADPGMKPASAPMPPPTAATTAPIPPTPPNEEPPPTAPAEPTEPVPAVDAPATRTQAAIEEPTLRPALAPAPMPRSERTTHGHRSTSGHPAEAAATSPKAKEASPSAAPQVPPQAPPPPAAVSAPAPPTETKAQDSSFRAGKPSRKDF